MWREWRYSSIMLDLVTRWSWVVSFTPGEREPWYYLHRNQGGPRAGLDAVEKRKLLSLVGIEPLRFSPQSVLFLLSWCQ
jgi:hypothetical protein